MGRCKNKRINIAKKIYTNSYKNNKENKIYKEIDYLVKKTSNIIKDMKDVTNYNNKYSYDIKNSFTNRYKINSKKEIKEQKNSIEEYFCLKNLNLNEGNRRKKHEYKYDFIKDFNNKVQTNQENTGNKRKRKHYMTIAYKKLNN